uniref:Uncharacterized protein n=1 Tax=Meloidogyne enterolobii TaxID=390850 RepID=A0A6V7UY26_MELEN|nr:unnamed protein product [Meloidogyne enterolobii]
MLVIKLMELRGLMQVQMQDSKLAAMLIKINEISSMLVKLTRKDVENYLSYLE